MPNISLALVPGHIGTQSREAYPGTLDLTAWQVAALQRDKPGVRDTGGQAAAGFERNAGIVTCMQHECRHAQLREERGDIGLANGPSSAPDKDGSKSCVD